MKDFFSSESEKDSFLKLERVSSWMQSYSSKFSKWLYYLFITYFS